MPTSPQASAKNEAKNLPIWTTVVVGLVVAFICGEVFDFSYILRMATVIVVVLALEGTNQLVRRHKRSR